MKLANKARSIDVVSFLILTALAALCGCDGPPPAAENPQAAATPPAASSTPAARTPHSTKTPTAGSAKASTTEAAAKPISDEEAQAFAKTLETTFKSSDRAAIDAVFDYDALLSRALQGIEVDEQMRQGLIDGTKPNLTGPDGIAARQAQSFAAGEHDRLLRVHRQGNEQRALFRCIGKGANYIDYILVRSADGKVIVGDIFDYIDGGLQSEELHREALAVAAQSNPGLISRLSPAEREYCAFYSTIQEMRHLMSESKFKEAVDIYQRLPDVLKNHRQLFHERLVAVCRLQEDCSEAIRAYRAAYPDDVGIELHLRIYYARHNSSDDYLASTDRLDKAVGGDPYLDASRSLIYADKGDLAAAKKCAENALAVEPDDPFALHCLDVVTKVKKDGPAGRPGSGLGPGGPSPGQPAGDEEAKAFAEAFAKSLIAGDSAAVHAAFDIPTIYQRAIAGIKIPDGLRPRLEGAVAKSIDAGLTELANSSGTLASKGGSFQLLRLHRAGGKQIATYRIIEHKNDEDELDYGDCILTRHADGKVRIDDFHSVREAMSFSHGMRRFVLVMLEQASNPAATARPESTGENSQFFAARAEIAKKRKEDQYQAALDVYDSLPDSLKNDKDILIERVKTAKHLKGKAFDDAIRAYRQAFPNEANLNMFLLDGYLEHKSYDRALAAIDALDESVGGDPYLDLRRANVFQLKGDRAQAKASANKAVTAEPSLRPAYDLLLTISLDEKRFSETARLLTIVQKKFPEHMPAVQTDPAYAGFLKSSSYRLWSRTQKR